MSRLKEIGTKLLPVRRSVAQCGLWGVGLGLSLSMIALLLILLNQNEMGATLLLATAWFYPAALLLTLFAPPSLSGRRWLWVALLTLMLVLWSVSLAAWLSLTAAAMFLAAQAPLAPRRNIILGVWLLMTATWAGFSLKGLVWAGAVSGGLVFAQGVAFVWVASRLSGEKQNFESD